MNWFTKHLDLPVFIHYILLYKSSFLYFLWKDTIMDSMTRDTEATMIRLTGLTMTATEAETATIISTLILRGKQREQLHTHKLHM